ncbi:type I secretion system permease/ATPase [Pseudomonas sp. NPDC090755]|uniref:type I secretion system permease/ATPase n=1 Tax=Pseudomonas sp. NPDC090755 TaxID=3364481 RepID=UPI00383BC6C1
MSTVQVIPAAPLQGRAGECDSLCLTLAELSERLGHPLPAESFSENAARCDEGRVAVSDVLQNMRTLSFEGQLLECALAKIPDEAFPLVVFRHSGEALLLHARRQMKNQVAYDVWWPEIQASTHLGAEELEEQLVKTCLLVKPPLHEAPARGLVPHSHSKTGWFWKTLWRYRGYYAEAALGTLLINVLALGGSFFSMTVYDKVLPNEAYASLWVLAIGALIAAVFEFFLRNLRAWVVDKGGKKADLVISSILFRHSMALRMEGRPGSAGAYASNMGSFEGLREFFSSAAVLALADLPFALLFVAVIGAVSGVLWIVPAVAIPVLIFVGLIAQIPLKRLAVEHMKVAGDKHGLLVESIDGLEEIKAARAEGWMVRRWENINALNAKSASQSRLVVSLVSTFSSHVQQLSTMALVVWGVYLINAGDMTMGGLIAATILCGRALSPFANVLALAGRWQQSRSSLEALSMLMQRPVEREEGKRYVTLRHVRGRMGLKGVDFKYPNTELPSLAGFDLSIEPGQKIGLLGKVGSGKSTLLRMMAGYYWSAEGQVTLDNIDLRQIDPALLRKHVGLMGQDARLFKGTLRDNLVMGHTEIEEASVFDVLKNLCLLDWINTLPDGLDTQLGENGAGLSGGQKQLLALARLMLGNPSVVLLDEPTSALDKATEASVIAALKNWIGGRTLVLATHRPSMLELVEAVVVIEQGQVVRSGSRERLSEG